MSVAAGAHRRLARPFWGKSMTDKFPKPEDAPVINQDVAGDELSDDDLNMVSGGGANPPKPPATPQAI